MNFNNNEIFLAFFAVLCNFLNTKIKNKNKHKKQVKFK